MARKQFRSGGARRLTTWIGFNPVQTDGLAVAGGSAIFSLNAAALALRPFTIVRTHFEFALRSDQAGAIEQ